MTRTVAGLAAALVGATLAAALPIARAKGAEAIETERIEWRWTTRQVVAPGTVSSEDGLPRVTATAPERVSMGINDAIAVRVGDRTWTGWVAAEPVPAEDGVGYRFAVRLRPDPALRPGVAAYVPITVLDRRVVAVPLAAVHTGPDGSSIGVVTSAGRVENRPVRIGGAVPGGYVEILSGVRVDERVVVAHPESDPSSPGAATPSPRPSSAS